jgi:hypothetical protein
MAQRHFTVLAAFVFGAASCGALEPEQDVSKTSSPIIGGKATAVCEWPTTVLVGGGCSGTLVHPRVVMTAKHCLGRTPASISFGEARGQIAKTVKVTTCYKNPQSDFGFCTLAEDVTGIPIIPVMAPCEMSEMKMGAPIVEAGFGDQTGAKTGFGTKKWIAGTVSRASPTRTTVDVTTGTQDGEYFGDSGGPVFIKMPDSTWRLIGNDWTSPDWNSSGRPRISTYTSVPFHVAWAEQQAGIDLTPCHDAQGWNPGPDCKGVPTNPGEGVGTWENSCAGQTLLLASTCTGADGGTVIDASPPPTDSKPAATDTASPTDVRAPDVTPNAGEDVHGAGGPADVTGAPGAPEVSVPGKLPGSQVDAGTTPRPGLSGPVAGGCSCETAPGGRSPSLMSLGAILGCALALRARKRRQRQR